MPRPIWEVLERAKVYDLGQPWFEGMPRRLVHPPYMMSLSRSHNDPLAPGIHAAFSIFCMGDHTGTHIDALCHVGEGGKVYGHPENVREHESYASGVAIGGIEETPPIIRRGILLDVPRLRGVEVLGGDVEITGDDLTAAEKDHGVQVREGDVVLVRTGWARYFASEPLKYNAPDETVPGLGVTAAEWLVGRKVSFTGSDTIAYEKFDKSHLMVHRILIARNGIQIIEMMNLDDVARDRVYEFAFISLPLRMLRATASPIRPVALV